MVLHLKRNTALKYMGEESKKRYIIEIRYVDAAGRKGKPNEWVYEELDIRTDSSTTNGVGLRLESSTGAYFTVSHGGQVNIGSTLYLDNNEIWAKNSNNLNVKADGLIRIQPQSY